MFELPKFLEFGARVFEDDINNKVMI